MALSFYEIRKRTASLVSDMIAKDFSNEEILYAALSKYGSSDRMVQRFIELEEAKIARTLKVANERKEK